VAAQSVCRFERAKLCRLLLQLCFHAATVGCDCWGGGVGLNAQFPGYGHFGDGGGTLAPRIRFDKWMRHHRRWCTGVGSGELDLEPTALVEQAG